MEDPRQGRATFIIHPSYFILSLAFAFAVAADARAILGLPAPVCVLSFVHEILHADEPLGLDRFRKLHSARSRSGILAGAFEYAGFCRGDGSVYDVLCFVFS